MATASEDVGERAEPESLATVQTGADAAEPLPAADAQTAMATTPAATSTPVRVASELRNLLAGLSVTPRPDGGLVLHADRESSAVLVQLLRGLASAIEGGAARPPRA